MKDHQHNFQLFRSLTGKTAIPYRIQVPDALKVTGYQPALVKRIWR